MQALKNITICCLIALCTQAFSAKMLVPPAGSEAVECTQSYQRAVQPKLPINIRDSMLPICRSKGGFRVLYKVIVPEDVDNPSALLFTCVGSDPDIVLFSCQFALSAEDL